MKYLLLFLLSFDLLAGGFAPESKITAKTQISKVFTQKQKCETFYSETCHELPNGYNMAFYEIQDKIIDDLANPVWSAKADIEVCSDQPDCEAKLPGKICTDAEMQKFINAGFTELYCSKIVSYPQIVDGKEIVINQTLEDSYDAEKLAESLKESAIKSAIKRMDAGKRVIGLLLVKNSAKGLSKGQIKQMNQTYAAIKDLLETGSLETAKDEINLITPDGIIVTSEDKAALVAEIDELLLNL